MREAHTHTHWYVYKLTLFFRCISGCSYLLSHSLFSSMAWFAKRLTNQWHFPIGCTHIPSNDLCSCVQCVREFVCLFFIHHCKHSLRSFSSSYFPLPFISRLIWLVYFIFWSATSYVYTLDVHSTHDTQWLHAIYSLIFSSFFLKITVVHSVFNSLTLLCVPLQYVLYS